MISEQVPTETISVQTVATERYPTYKDSGVDWLGEIPEHWEMMKSKYLWKEKIDISETGEEMLLSVSQYFGVNTREDSSRTESLVGYKKVEENDLVINIMLAWLGGLGLSSYAGVVSPAYAVYRQTKELNPKFLHYLYRTDLYLDEFGRRSKGVVPSRWRMYTDDFGQVVTLLPSLSEQTRIAEFLDQKTAQIDQAIAQKERLIELLNERRQVMINKAVTRGLDPNVPMKDSGIDWIGEIPAHWEAIKVKNIFRLIVEPAPNNNDFELLSVYTDIGVKPRKELEERGNKASTTDGYWLVKKGDIIVNKLLAWMGAIGLSNYNGVTSPAYDILRAKRPVAGEYYHALFRSPVCSSELKRHSRGIMDMRLRLYFDKFGDILVPYPPVTEQLNITKKLNHIDSEINNAKGFLQTQIEKLQELKSTLINSAVTGKIKV